MLFDFNTFDLQLGQHPAICAKTLEKGPAKPFGAKSAVPAKKTVARSRLWALHS
jgi:hypothetical protein